MPAGLLLNGICSLKMHQFPELWCNVGRQYCYRNQCLLHLNKDKAEVLIGVFFNFFNQIGQSFIEVHLGKTQTLPTRLLCTSSKLNFCLKHPQFYVIITRLSKTLLTAATRDQVKGLHCDIYLNTLIISLCCVPQMHLLSFK